MGTTHATLYRNPKQVYPWQGLDAGGGTGAHVVANTWADEPKCFLMETDNNAFAKYKWLHTPKDGQNPNISTFWECWFRSPVDSPQFYFTILQRS